MLIHLKCAVFTNYYIGVVGSSLLKLNDLDSILLNIINNIYPKYIRVLRWPLLKYISKVRQKMWRILFPGTLKYKRMIQFQPDLVSVKKKRNFELEDFPVSTDQKVKIEES